MDLADGFAYARRVVETAHLPDPAVTYRRFLVYADDLGVLGKHEEYRAHGTLWLPWERRGDLLRLVRELRASTGYDGTVLAALNRTDAEAFGLALIDELFQRRWISYRCLVTKAPRESLVDVSALTVLAVRRLRTLPGGLAEREVRLRLRRRKGKEEGDPRVASDRLGRALEEHLHLPVSFTRSIRAARSAEALQLVQFLGTLIADDWEKKPGTGSVHRKRLSERAAENLGWTDLAGDTVASEWKFNIAYVDDPKLSEPPPTPQRAVQLRLPLVD